MVNIFKEKHSALRKRPSGDLVGKQIRVKISTLDHTGMGVVSDHKPVIFVEGALPGETVDIVIKEQKARFCRAEPLEILRASVDRVEPFCPHLNQCGGCQLQHLNADSACSLKLASIEQMIMHTPIASTSDKPVKRKKGSLAVKTRPKSVQRTIGDLFDTLPWKETIHSDSLGYRRKTRLSLDARNRQEVKLGFRQSGSKQIFSLQECRVLTTGIQSLIQPLQDVVGSLQNPSAIGHVSIFDGNHGVYVCFRIVKTLGQQDQTKLIEFSQQNQVQLAFEDNQHQISSVNDEQGSLAFNPSSKIEISAGINDFIQVNNSVNQRMIERACEWLNLGSADRVLDLFCGIGNFSLPMATRCQHVTGVEGVAKMVQSAAHNALKNDISNCEFKQADLSNPYALSKNEMSKFNKVLLDPAREGADAAVEEIAKASPSHILYVSCNPATFARDAAKLVAQKYRIDKISLMDMFPQTAHTELMALFVPNQ